MSTSKTSYTSAEQEKLVMNIIYSSNLFNLVSNRIFKPFDLTMQQYNVLRILREAQGFPLSITDIESKMLDRSSNVSRLIDKLVSKDFVTRVESRKDRRKMKIKIKEDGASVLKEIDEIIFEMNSDLQDIITHVEARDANKTINKIRRLHFDKYLKS
jgi:DNA-binding MarR family transcriptional regulator